MSNTKLVRLVFNNPLVPAPHEIFEISSEIVDPYKQLMTILYYLANQEGEDWINDLLGNMFLPNEELRDSIEPSFFHKKLFKEILFDIRVVEIVSVVDTKPSDRVKNISYD